MDYEKKYNEALERAQKVTRAGGDVAVVIVQNIFPELRESEDERIRKGLIEALKTSKTVGELKFILPEPTRKECIAYLEKQKEQKPVDDKSFEEWVDDWWKHHKVNNPDSYDKGDEIQFDERGFKNFCRGIKNMYAEQKPADRFEEAREKYQVEWSDNDDRLIGFIFDLLNDLAWRKDWAMSKEECLERLKSIRPQPKQEWSEEDEKMRINILNALTPQLVYSVGKGTCTGTSTYKYDDEIKWLKSLRSSWKPSEQEKGALRTAIHILTDERSFPKAAAHLQNILDAFEGKESRKDWKPSEEQMTNLLRAEGRLRIEGESVLASKLAELYEQLKKLM